MNAIMGSGHWQRSFAGGYWEFQVVVVASDPR
jgi:hypothetical protein